MIDEYLRFMAAQPQPFSARGVDGFTLVTDRDELTRAMKSIEASLVGEGHPATWSEPGIFYEDRWVWVLREILRLPDGGYGTYHRVVPKAGADGVILVPMIDERIVIIKHYRNGLGACSWELPRGGPDLQLSTDDLARTELEEEIGASVAELNKIGVIEPNAGMITVRLHVYRARLRSLGTMNTVEGIMGYRLMTIREVEAAIATSEIKDGHTLAALMLLKLADGF